MSKKQPPSDGPFYLAPEQGSGVEFPPPESLQPMSHCGSFAKYQELYALSLAEPEAFWKPLALEYLDWETPWSEGKFFEGNFDVSKGPISIKWMADGRTNVCHSVLDYQIKKRKCGDKVVFYWEGNYPGDSFSVTYQQLLDDVCKFANVLKSKGVKKGDRVAVYVPMIIPLAVVMLACARIGAVHSVIFGGFSSEALAARIMDADAKILITTDGVWRGPKLIRLKDIADGAVKICQESNHALRHCVVIRHLCPEDNGPSPEPAESVPGKRPNPALKVSWNSDLDCWYHEEMAKADPQCPVEWLNAEDPLFMLYTSGSTGKPKGVLHTQAGYLLYAATTFRYDFDHQPDDVYWCTADLGWITGHSYVLYGPMANGATSVMFEGVPFFPDPSRYWDVVDKYKVTKFYTAPTAIRSLMKHGDKFVTKCDRSSLKILGTVGEPINPEAWRWYNEVVGDSKCAVVDTYWQTETGGHVITPLPAATVARPGSATFPFFGIEPAIMSEEGKEIEGPGEGYLVFKRPWPGIMRTVYGDHARFEKTYFSKFPGYYCSGDGCRRDDDGYYWITGRIDDMMNVSGHLLSTAEIESAMVSHPAVAEAAIVAAKHEIKGEAPYCFLTLKNGYKFTDELVTELKLIVRKKIGPVAVPDWIQEAPGLPKTRSGKIMRRILRVVASSPCMASASDLGDTSTLADPTVVEQLYENKQFMRATS